MNEKRALTPDEIAVIVKGLDPIDRNQMELLANLPIAKRIIYPMLAQEFSMAVLCSTFRKSFPDLSTAEINMKVLAYLTPLRMGSK
jgi:hypothetical protein